MSLQQLVQQRQDIRFPYTLPSQGLLYSGKVPEGKVEIRPVRGPQEEILSTLAEEGGDDGPLLRQIVKDLTIFPQGFDFLDLLFTDYFSLLLNILAASYDTTFTITPKCGHCGHENKIDVNIKDFATITPQIVLTSHIENKLVDKDTTLEQFYKEPFMVKADGADVGINLLRLRDVEKLEQRAEELKRNNTEGLPGKLASLSLAAQIQSVNGDTNFTNMLVFQWIHGMVGGEKVKLKKNMAFLDTGYDMHPTIKCRRKACRKIFRVEMPLTGAAFLRLFRPDNRFHRTATL